MWSRRRAKHMVGAMISMSVAIGVQALAGDIYIDNLRGDDSNRGDKDQPFATLSRALEALRGGDTLHLTPNPKPYQERIDLKESRWAGTLAKPTVINGHGSTLSMLLHLDGAHWDDEGNGVFSRELKNNAWVMDRQGYWSGFPIVFLDGEPAAFATSRDRLQVSQYFLQKDYPPKGTERSPLHNRLFIRLPAGKTPDDIRVETLDCVTNVHIGVDHVTVKNLVSMYSSADAFSSSRAKGLVFDNVRGCYSMDQGISHHGSEVLVKNSRFDHNAGCGVVDVWDECRVRYEGCVIEEDAFRGGVEFHDGTFAMTNCVIRFNHGKALSIARQATVKLRDCTLVGASGSTGVHVSPDCALDMAGCRLAGFATGLRIWTGEGGSVSAKVKGCTFEDCKTAYHLSCDPSQLEFDDNTLGVGSITLNQKSFSPEDWERFIRKGGLGANSRR